MSEVWIDALPKEKSTKTHEAEIAWLETEAAAIWELEALREVRKKGREQVSLKC